MVSPVTSIVRTTWTVGDENNGVDLLEISRVNEASLLAFWKRREIRDLSNASSLLVYLWRIIL